MCSGGDSAHDAPQKMQASRIQIPPHSQQAWFAASSGLSWFIPAKGTCAEDVAWLTVSRQD
jgi:hypothetical protein